MTNDEAILKYVDDNKDAILRYVKGDLDAVMKCLDDNLIGVEKFSDITTGNLLRLSDSLRKTQLGMAVLAVLISLLGVLVMLLSQKVGGLT